MRCHYISDLHLESQEFRHELPRGDILIIAGDLCHASALDPARTDPYRVKQRDRVLRFVETATKAFVHVLMVAGNHEHYDGVFEHTVPLLRRHLPGVTILDDECIEIEGTRFFGTTLWTDLEGRNDAAMEKIRRGVGEYFFAKTRLPIDRSDSNLVKLRPADTLAAHDCSITRLIGLTSPNKPSVIITHHAPSLQGLNPQHRGNGLDGAYASDLDRLIADLSVPFWVHGHTHIRNRYRIGDTTLLANCRGFDGKDLSARTFSPASYFEV